MGALNSLSCKILELFTRTEHEAGEASRQQMKTITMWIEQH